MKNKKHSKYKNTGILFELLVRQVASDTVNGIDSSPALKIMKEFFRTNKELSRELQLYTSLMTEKFSQESRATKLIDAVLNERARLNNTVLKRQKYNLIREIKRHYDLISFFKNKIDNYKTCASICTLFENQSIKPKSLVDYHFTIVEHITSNKVTPETKKTLVEKYKTQNKDVRLLSYKILIDKFNEKYSTKLNEHQRKALRQLINNVNSTSTLTEYVNKEAIRIKKSLVDISKKIPNNVIKIKLNEVKNQLDIISKSKRASDKQVLVLMRFHELVKECNNVIK